MFHKIFSLPLFGILLSIGCYAAGTVMRRFFKSSLVNPLVIANILLLLIISFTPVKIEEYLAGGNFIAMFMGPVTVILARRIYRQRKRLLENIVPVLAGCGAGSLSAVASTWAFCALFGVNKEITVSLLPRSVTTAIALELSKNSGGLPGVTISAVIITGVFSAAAAPFFIKVFKLKDPVAAGVAMGTSGHAICTAAAIELGDSYGAMSGAAIGIAGIITSLVFAVMGVLGAGF